MKYSCSACQFRRTAATSLKAARCPTRLQILGNLLPSSQRQCRHHEEESPNGANRKKKGGRFFKRELRDNHARQDMGLLQICNRRREFNTSLWGVLAWLLETAPIKVPPVHQ